MRDRTSYHSIFFAHDYDPNNMGFRSLHVNKDQITPGAGFANHPHQKMETELLTEANTDAEVLLFDLDCSIWRRK
jgi:redox-sensitive bicupin YhaK (pirin superfamily)